MSSLARHGVPLVVIAVTAAVWGPVVAGQFQYDDLGNIVNDPATSDLGALVARLATGIRPLTRASYFLDAALFGMVPAAFLATNLLLHLITVLLVHALAFARLGDARAAFVAALVFALQPAHAETVAYASGRSTGLMAALVVAGFLLHERRRPIASLVCFALACLAKEVALVFPLLLLLWEITRPSPRMKPVAAATLLAGALAAVALLSPRYRDLAAFSLELRSPGANLLAGARAIPETLSLWFRPWALSVDHGFDPSLHVGASLAGLAAIAALVAAALAVRSRVPLFTLAAGWALLCLAPTSTLIAKLDLVSEKPLYLAAVGPALLAGQWASSFTRRGRVRLRVVAVAMMLACSAAWCVHRVSLWRAPHLLWTDAASKAPGKSRCWNNLGMALFRLERDPEAAAALREATRLDPTSATARRNLELVEFLCGPRCL